MPVGARLCPSVLVRRRRASICGDLPVPRVETGEEWKDTGGMFHNDEVRDA